MLPMDPQTGRKITAQYGRESGHKVEMVRLRRRSCLHTTGWVSRVGRRLVGQAGRLLSTAGSWLEQDSIASKLPLDGQLGRTA